MTARKTIREHRLEQQSFSDYAEEPPGKAM
jgi:hypothetical protein